MKPKLMMKAKLSCFLPLLLVASLPLGAAESKQVRVYARSEAATPGTTELHTELRQRSGAVEMEKVAFLGVATGPVSPTLTSQLVLPAGSGLVVNQVVPGSPAADALQPHDILLKLDDQLLIESNQLAVLIRNHKEGDEVTLTYLRAGKQATARVKLKLHEAPKLAIRDAEPPVMPFRLTKSDAGVGRQEVDRVLSLIDAHQQPDGVAAMAPGGPGMRVININTGNSSMVFSDDEGALEITIKDGKKTVVAKDAKGAQIFSGPITTAEERKALPPKLAERISKLESMQDFEFKTGADFQGGDIRVMTPPARRISLPMDVRPASPRVPAF